MTDDELAEFLYSHDILREVYELLIAVNTKPFKLHLQKTPQLLRPYVPGEMLTNVMVPEKFTPQEGGMILKHQMTGQLYYVPKEIVEHHFEPMR
jgi:hypothetical protein